jgi:hypothetical protein
MENRKAYGRYFSGNPIRKNRSIKWMKETKENYKPRIKTYNRVCQRRKNRKNYRPRWKPQPTRL